MMIPKQQISNECSSLEPVCDNRMHCFITNPLILYIDASYVCRSSERDPEDLRDTTTQHGLLKEIFDLLIFNPEST